ncbi:MAG: ABC transporter ATP-binding protein, partial [Spirochaetales bacterium]|nr:ABC transporter ATP-binding protein [Candidatus Physcosoma equi]
MREFLPLIIVGAVIGAFTVVFAFAYLALKKRMKDDSKERHMEDRELVARMAHYAKPHWKAFLVIFFIMVLSITYDVASPLIVGEIQGTITTPGFALDALKRLVILYASMLTVSMVSTYLQAIFLQKVGQKILSDIRMDTFTHIEQLSHAQLSQIPVGKLVTRVSNDPNSISFLFTNILVTLVKNFMVIIGVLGAMLVLNYALTLMVLCFVPFLIAFTIIFKKFSRHVHRLVNNSRTNLNTFLSENLSGMKVTQIFNQTDRKKKEFDERSKKLEKAKYSRMFVFGIFRPMVYMLFVGSNLFLFYFACRGYIRNTVFLGSVITSQVVVEFYMYISRFFNPIQAIAEQFDMLEQSFASADKIYSILDMVPELVHEDGAM